MNDKKIWIMNIRVSCEFRLFNFDNQYLSPCLSWLSPNWTWTPSEFGLLLSYQEVVMMCCFCMENEWRKKNRFSPMKPSTCDATSVTGILRGGCSIFLSYKVDVWVTFAKTWFFTIHAISSTILLLYSFKRGQSCRCLIVAMPRYLASLCIPNSIGGSPTTNDHFVP